MVEEYPQWDKLPNDILQLIVERLGIVDRIRFELVCKGWRANTKRTPQLAWQLLSNEANCEQLTFFDSTESATHTFKLPEAVRGGMFAAASNGWLVVLKGTKQHVDVSLYDPISRHQVPLPSLSTIFSILMLDRSSILRRRIQYSTVWNVNPFVQVAVSSSPSSDAAASQCIVAVRFRDDQYVLGLCRPQDESWTIFEGVGYAFRHMLFCDGELFVLKRSGNGDPSTFETQSITLGGGGGCKLKLKLIPCILPEVRSCRILPEYCWKKYLVESKGQVWIFIKKNESIMITLDDYPCSEFSNSEIIQIQTTDNAYTIIRNRRNNPTFLVDGVECFSPKIKVRTFK